MGVGEQRRWRARAARPFRAEWPTRQPQEQEQREDPRAPSAALRRPRFSGQPAIARESTAASTTARQATLSASSHVLLTSLPVPKPCSSAIGQLAYVSQWIARQLA